MKIPVALQLYTVRDQTAADFLGTLEKVAKMGYKGVEFAGFGQIAARDMASALDSLGIAAMGSHTSLELLKDKLDEVIEYNLAINNRYIICPKATFESREDYSETARFFNEVGEKCRKHGLKFCYHNHAHEFVLYDDEYGFDILYKETDPELVKAEIDTYWVKYAGEDPVRYIEKYAGRCPLVHLKDMEASEDRHFAEIGNGTMDIRGIAEAAKKAGAEWFVVEQDRCRRPSLESAAISIGNLRGMGLA